MRSMVGPNQDWTYLSLSELETVFPGIIKVLSTCWNHAGIWCLSLWLWLINISLGMHCITGSWLGWWVWNKFLKFWYQIAWFLYLGGKISVSCGEPPPSHQINPIQSKFSTTGIRHLFVTSTWKPGLQCNPQMQSHMAPCRRCPDLRG